MKTRKFLFAGAAVVAGWLTPAAVEEKYDDLAKRGYRGPIANERHGARPNFSLSPSRLTRSKFWLARMVYRFAVISPALWILGSLVVSFCLLLAAFSL
jgi:hypothetical protein